MAQASSIDLLRARAQSRDAGRSDAELAVRAQLSVIVDELGAQEVQVLGLLARRLLDGQRTYGPVDVARDPRDFEAERGDEFADALVYGAFAELRRLLAKQKGAA